MNFRIRIAVIICCLILGVKSEIMAQALTGTTGLLYMPTADMQKDKTFMMGGNAINLSLLSTYFSSKEVEHTYDYYINMTFFPWLEVAYMCTLKYIDKGSTWPEETWSSYPNQDRAFHVRLRLWKEGWWKEWTPQIVIGGNDFVTHNDHGGGGYSSGNEAGNNNYQTRYYIAATKHFDFDNIGELGAHVTLIHSKGIGLPHYTRPAAGVNFRFALPESSFWNKAVNGLNLMAEHDARTFNVGGQYSFWKDRINLVAALNDGKYFSGGLYFKICLK